MPTWRGLITEDVSWRIVAYSQSLGTQPGQQPDARQRPRQGEQGRQSRERR